MAAGNQGRSNSGRTGNSSWAFGGWRKPKQLQAQNINIDEIFPSELPRGGANKRRRNGIIALMVLGVVVIAVVSGVVLWRSRSKDEPELPTEPTTPSSPRGPSPETPVTTPPTAAPSTQSAADQFLSGLPPYSKQLVEADPNSPQAQAMVWLKRDPKYSEYDLHRLYQRYALAVLFYSTEGELWTNSTGWLSIADECTWFMEYFNTDTDNACGGESRLTKLSLMNNKLNGSVPTELELLADLQTMYFGDDTLTVAINSELYVS
jgi:hypothetical protein